MIQRRSKKPIRITVPTASSLDFKSEAVLSRLSRIEVHYQELEMLLAALESKMPQDSASPAESQGSVASRIVRKPR